MDEFTLEGRLALGPLPPGEAVELLVALAGQVQAWHERGWLHRRIEPGQVTLGRAPGEARLAEPAAQSASFCRGDWQPDKEPSELAHRPPLDLPREREAVRVLLDERRIDVAPPQIDLYQLGAVLCRVLTGASVSEYLNGGELTTRIPAALVEPMERMLGLRKQRFDSAAAFAESLLSAWTQRSDLPTFISPADSPLEAESQRAAGPRPLPFPRIGDYDLVRHIGSGGMGDVFLGRDERLEREVALKILPDEMARNPDLVRRFYSEAAAMSRLESPNVIQIDFVGADQGRHFFAMEYIDGGSLAERLAAGERFTTDETLRIVEEVLKGLQTAHGAGLVHRDIKPENILLTRPGRVVVADFGLVKSLQESTSLTSTGVVLGSAEYISPEQARGAAVDARADLYAVGVLLYRLLGHRLPFAADSMTSLIFQHVYETPPRLTELQPGFSPVLGMIVEKLMAKSPAQRYAAAADVLADFSAYRRQQPLPSGADIIDLAGDDDVAILQAAGTAHAKRTLPRLDSLPRGWFTAPLPAWRARLVKLWDRIPAWRPRILQRLRTDEQQLDAALSDYDRHAQHLRNLLADDVRTLQDLKDQRPADGSPASPDVETAIREQQAQIAALRMQFATVSATLETMRSRQALLAARLQIAETRRRLSGRRRFQRAVLAPLIGLLALLAGYWFWFGARKPDGPAPTALAPTAKADPVPIQASAQDVFLPSRHFEGAVHVPASISFSPDSRRLIAISDSNSKEVDMWDARTTDPVTLPLETQGFRPFRSAVFVRDRLVVTTAEQPARVFIIDASSGTIERTRELTELVGRTVKSASLAGSRLIIATTGYPSRVLLIDVSSGAVVRSLEPEDFATHAVSASGALAAFRSVSKGPLEIWDLERGEELFAIPDQSVRGCAFTPDGERLVFIHRDESQIVPGKRMPEHYLDLVVWNVKSDSQILRVPLKGEASGPSLSPDGRWMVLSRDAGESLQPRGKAVELWDARTWRPIGTWSVDEPIVALRFHPHRPLLAIGSESMIALWNIDSNSIIGRFRCRALRGLAFSPDGRTLAYRGGEVSPRIATWDLRFRAPATPAPAKSLPAGFHTQTWLAPDASAYLTYEERPDPALRVRSLEDGSVKATLARGARIDSGGALSRESKYAAFFEVQKTGRVLRVLKVSTGEKKLDVSLPPYYRSPRAEFVPSDPERLLVVNAGGAALWDLQTAQIQGTLPASQEVVDATISSDGSRVALILDEGDKWRTELWDLSQRRRERSLEAVAAPGEVGKAQFSSDGARLATVTRDQIDVWEVSNGKRLQTFKVAHPLSCAFRPHSHQLATGGSQILLWSGTETIHEVASKGGIPSGLAFSTDGRWLYAAQNKALNVFESESASALTLDY